MCGNIWKVVVHGSRKGQVTGGICDCKVVQMGRITCMFNIKGVLSSEFCISHCIQECVRERHRDINGRWSWGSNMCVVERPVTLGCPWCGTSDGDGVKLVFVAVFNREELKSHESTSVLEADMHPLVEFKTLCPLSSKRALVFVSHRVNDKAVFTDLILRKECDGAILVVWGFIDTEQYWVVPSGARSDFNETINNRDFARFSSFRVISN